jgi:hypothetical protein
MAKTAGHTWADYKTEIAQDLNMLQRTNATTNECYNERMLQRTAFINKIRVLQRKHSTTKA